MMPLVDKAVAIIKAGNPNNKDYNVARRLCQIKKQIERNAKESE